MTIKLLAQYGRAPVGAILTLDSATETSLVGSKQASTDLTGGVWWTDPQAAAPATQVPLVQDQSSGAAVGSGRARVLSPGGRVRPNVALNKQTQPWTRLFGANDFAGGSWSKSAEVTTAATYVTAQSAANGPAMFRREGCSMMIDGAAMSASPGNLRTFAASISNAANGPLVNQTLALLVFVHRPSTGSISLRIGTDSGNYVVWRWRYDYNMLQEGWNVLLAHTGAPVGGAAVAAYTQHAYQAGAPQTPSEAWRSDLGAGTFSFGGGGTITYVAIEMGGIKAGALGNGHLWIEGLYVGGRERPRITVGFDISNSGLDNALAIMSKYGLRGYAAVPTSNGNSAAPAYLWSAADEARMQALHNAGWDIVGHSASHNPLGNYTDHSMIRCELEASRQQSARLGCLGATDMFATPNGSSSNRVVYAMKQLGMEWCRNVNTSPMLLCSSLVGWANPLAQGALGIASSGLGDATDYLISKNFIDMLVMYGVSGNLYTHGVFDNPVTNLDTRTSVFDQVMAYLSSLVNAGIVEVVTPSEMIRGAPAVNLDAALAGPSRLVLALTASPADVINTGFTPMRLLVSGGTVSAITYSRDGTVFDGTGQTSGVFDVLPGDRLRITYSAAPTVVQMSI